MADRKVFNDSVTPLPDQEALTPDGMAVHAIEPEHSGETMTLLFSLELPQDAQAQLEAKVAKGEVVPLAELQSTYTPKAANVEKLESWLKAQGFEITHVSDSGMGVYARAPVDLIEKILKVKMVRVTRDGITYTAAQNAPSLPSDVGEGVHAIIGLQPFRHANKHFRSLAPQQGSQKPSAKRTRAARCVPCRSKCPTLPRAGGAQSL